MNLLQKTTRLIAVLVLAVILVGCSGQPAAVAPTQDLNLVRTEAAQTVVAKITIAAALQPTATFTPFSTATEAATATSMPSPTPVVLDTATPLPTVKPPSGVIYPTRTVRSGPDQAQLVSQLPTDGTDYNAGEEFDGAWTFKNVGTSTWSTDYDYRWSGGTNIALADYYPMPKTVAPGETITLYADMKAPSSSGRHVTNWELINGNGDVFYQFYLVIDVR